MDKLNSLAAESAIMGIGVFPRSVINADGSETQRTPFQNGWNAAVMAIKDNYLAIQEWLVDMPIRHSDFLADIDDYGRLQLHVADREIHPQIIVNDTFERATADAEPFTTKEIDEILVVWRRFKHDGLNAWVAKRRSLEPIKELQTEQYREAKSMLES